MAAVGVSRYKFIKMPLNAVLGWQFTCFVGCSLFIRFVLLSGNNCDNNKEARIQTAQSFCMLLLFVYEPLSLVEVSV